MVDINEAKLEAGRRYGIEVNGVKESNLRFMSFAEWTSAETKMRGVGIESLS
jgi:hypothetical protein